MNVLDFCTCLVFDWFMASDTAFDPCVWHHLPRYQRFSST